MAIKQRMRRFGRSTIGRVMRHHHGAARRGMSLGHKPHRGKLFHQPSGGGVTVFGIGRVGADRGDAQQIKQTR